MSSCTFCGGDITPGTGKMYIKRDGTVWRFCKSKCQHNQVDMHRVNRHVGWTQAFAEHKGDRQTVRAGAAAAKGGKGAAKAAAPAKAAKPAAPKAAKAETPKVAKGPKAETPKAAE